MNSGTATSTPAPPAWARIAGPLLTVAVAGLTELSADTPFRITNPPALLVLAIVFAAFRGGLGPGLISAAIAWAYVAYFFSLPGQVLQFTDENLRRVIVWALVMPLTTFMVGLLNRRTARALAEAEVARLRQGREEDRLRASEALEAERARAEQAIRRQMRMNDAMFEQAITCFVLLDRDARILRVNEAFATHYRKSAGDLMGRKYFEAIPYDGGPTTGSSLLAEVLATKQPLRASSRPYVFEDQPERGTTYWDWILQPILDERGEVEFFFFSSIEVTERKKTEDLLRASEAEFRAVFELGPGGQAQGDPRTGRLLRVNRNLCSLLGYSEEELLGIPFAEITHPDDRESDVAFFRRMIDGAIPEYTVEKRLVRKDGTFLWTQVTATVMRDALGRPERTLAVGVDITERKRAEERLLASLQEKDVLLREVHHRVKNNLQMISSLLALQAAALKDPAAAAALAESQNRVRAMGLVHEHLYRSSDLASVRLAGHVEALCAHLYRAYGVDPERIVLELRLADLVLDLDRSIRCGLVINELVSNALKHAFPNGRAGRILVELEASPDHSYSLTVADDGIGYPPAFDPRLSSSLGLQLVADLTDQLRGNLAWKRDGGTTITVRFPGDGVPEEDQATPLPVAH
jgi:PAS domain S-box-containing protein